MMSVAEFLSGRTFPGRLLFAKVWGSHSHHTALPEEGDRAWLLGVRGL